MYPIVILAGGLAKRIRPLTDKIPKAMININSKPFIYWLLRYYINQGINTYHILLGYKGEMIEKYLLSIKNLNVSIDYHYDGKELKGTGGALLKSCSSLPDKFLLLYGDTLLTINISEFIKFSLDHDLNNVMTIFENKDKWDNSNVTLLGKNMIDYSKNSENNRDYIDYGISIIDKQMFTDFCRQDIFDMSSYFAYLSEEKALYGYKVSKRFYEIGSFQGLKDTEKYVKDNLSLFE